MHGNCAVDQSGYRMSKSHSGRPGNLKVTSSNPDLTFSNPGRMNGTQNVMRLSGVASHGVGGLVSQ